MRHGGPTPAGKLGMHSDEQEGNTNSCISFCGFQFMRHCRFFSGDNCSIQRCYEKRELARISRSHRRIETGVKGARTKSAVKIANI